MASNKTKLKFDESPSVLPAYFAALTKGGKKLKGGETIPYMEAVQENVKPDSKKMQSFSQVCGFSNLSSVPVTYPHIMAMPLHMALLTHENFPLKLLGLVHVTNKITQHRLLDPQEALGLKVYIEGHREARSGIEADLITEFTDSGGNRVWEEVTTFLARGQGQSKDKDKSKSGKDKQQETEDQALEFGRYATFDAESDIGRRYAWVSGDFNPIHMSAPSAKLFGFPKAIAHGMWLLSRCVAELDEQLPEAYTVSVAFKKPVLLPSSVLLKYNPGEEGIEYVLLNEDGEKKHLLGAVTFN